MVHDTPTGKRTTSGARCDDPQVAVDTAASWTASVTRRCFQNWLRNCPDSQSLCSRWSNRSIQAIHCKEGFTVRRQGNLSVDCWPEVTQIYSTPSFRSKSKNRKHQQRAQWARMGAADSLDRKGNQAAYDSRKKQSVNGVERDGRKAKTCNSTGWKGRQTPRTQGHVIHRNDRTQIPSPANSNRSSLRGGRTYTDGLLAMRCAE
jgi:hypothetical protein